MYIISPITVFDNDHNLWETYIGLDSKGMPLLYSCWGKSKEESRKSAELFCSYLKIINAI